MKRKHANNKQCQFTVIIVETTVARTKFRSFSQTFHTYKSLRIVSTLVVGPILTKLWEQDDLFPGKLARQMIGQ